MALAQNTFYDTHPRPVTLTNAHLVEDAAQIWLNSLVGIDATSGLAIPYDGGLTAFMGLATHERLGTSGVYGAGDSRGEIVIDVSGPQIKVPVTAAASAADNGLPVWATDDGTFTKTDPTGSLPVGYIRNWLSGTTCWVQLLSAQEFFAQTT
ncbi:MAG: hypothetical protein DRH30_00880 [Deltaproteobacteria bacterium]|nr:MAG: hypothetical protein DRH30_00880 [Deltaproteobacteria bacterium]